ncbi:MAG: hypothetical protein KGL40_10945 [Rhodocyclaceae bacterium]|nr:hypothetical protein [Rhodocyclaceae bacterium]
MKLAKQRARKLKPRSGVVALLKKGGAHQRKDKRASRALHHARFRRQADET